MKRNKKIWGLVFALGAVFLILACIIIDRKPKETPEQQGGKYTEQSGEQTDSVKEPKEENLMYFQEEYLSFLTDNEKEHFKKEFSGFLKLHGKREDATCCVILGNVTALSEKTRMFYVQTNEPSGNLYQVIVNTEQGFWEMESYEGEITDIEVYGGVREGDNIERIYIYENPEADVEIEIPTLEEEQEAKEKTYQELP